MNSTAARAHSGAPAVHLCSAPLAVRERQTSRSAQRTCVCSEAQRATRSGDESVRLTNRNGVESTRVVALASDTIGRSARDARHNARAAGDAPQFVCLTDVRSVRPLAHSRSATARCAERTSLDNSRRTTVREYCTILVSNSYRSTTARVQFSVRSDTVARATDWTV